VRPWEVGAAAWAENLASLRAFVAAHGRLPLKAHPSGLGEWVYTQRRVRKAVDACMRARLTPARFTALDAVPGWTWDGRGAAWEEKLVALRAHVDAHGRLPTHREFLGLSKWVDTQRQAKKAMDADSASNMMTPARVAALEAVPGWTWDGRRGGSKRQRPDSGS
jgi:hypothetical protein